MNSKSYNIFFYSESCLFVDYSKLCLEVYEILKNKVNVLKGEKRNELEKIEVILRSLQFFITINC